MGDFVPTRVSRLKAAANESFIVVNHKSRKRKVEKGNDDTVRNTDVDEKLTTATWNKRTKRHLVRANNSKEDDAKDEKRKQELEMKRTRYEVMKFAMAGFDKAGAHQAKVALAVSLGAKPPKNKPVNYKILKQERSERKSKEEGETRASGLSKSMLGRKPARKTSQLRSRTKSSDGILGTYGRVDNKVIGKVKH